MMHSRSWFWFGIDLKMEASSSHDQDQFRSEFTAFSSEAAAIQAENDGLFD
jgi:hypothetical protein